MDLQLRLLPYQYRQLEGLEWIQVVKLWPSTTLAKPPRVDIQHVDRSSIPFSPLPERLNYDAVSYAWSEYTRNSKIVCNGDSILAITPTVYVMLQWLRHESKPRYLWIDSICLNQDDRQEKEVQIPQMGQIYREARKARVWLGEGAEDTQKVLTLLTVLGRANDPPDDATIADTFHKLHLGPVMKALKEFLHRKWFHRRWIIQEVALAGNVVFQCGAERISWPYLQQALRNCQTLFQQGKLELDRTAATALNTLGQVSGQGSDILDLLWQFDNAQCQDDRDRIYALSSLATNLATNTSLAKSIKAGVESLLVTCVVDYRCPTEDIYQQVAKGCIDVGYSMDVLYHATAFGSLNDLNREHASWVPDWSRARQSATEPYARLSTGQIDFHELYSAEFSTLPEMKHGGLVIKGRYAKVYKVINPEPFSRALKDPITWLDIALRLNSITSPKSRFDQHFSAPMVYTALFRAVRRVFSLQSHQHGYQSWNAEELHKFFTAILEEHRIFNGKFGLGQTAADLRQRITHHGARKPWMGDDLLDQLTVMLEKYVLFYAENLSDKAFPLVGVGPGTLRAGDHIFRTWLSLQNHNHWSDGIGIVLRDSSIKAVKEHGKLASLYGKLDSRVVNQATPWACTVVGQCFVAIWHHEFDEKKLEHPSPRHYLFTII